uniref:Putative splicing coactivator srm160/300 subunit n=1 Tax=Ixodes ricinus TaxID=34613 RepID=A0A0K8R9E7_IXORI
MREDSLLRLTQLFAVSHISYVASFHNWKAAEKIKINAMIRKAYKTALGLYPLLPNYFVNVLMLALGVHNTLEEIAEAQRTAQYHRLSQTRTGRTILQRIGINAPETTPEVAKQLPRDVLQRLRVPPLPKHMHPQVHQERRTARATALTKDHANDPCAYYADAAKYPHRHST